MDSSDEGSDLEGFPSLNKSNNGEFSVSGKSQLKPKLDSIFAEVEKKLPSIDFDLSDVSSDNEEPVIFHRNLKKSYFDDDKDLDTSLSQESMSDLLPAITMESLSLNSYTIDTEQENENQDVAPFAYDNDLAFQMQQLAPKCTSWTEVVREAHEDTDTNKFPERPSPKLQNWTSEDTQTDHDNTMSCLQNALNLMENEISGTSDFGCMTDMMDDLEEGEDLEKHEKESTSEKLKSQSEAKINTGDKKMDKYIEKEIRRNKEKEIVSSLVSSSAPRIDLEGIGGIDLDMVLDSLNEDNQLAPPVVRQAWQTPRRIDTIFAGGESANISNDNQSNKTLIQRLAEMSMTHCDENLGDIDPTTGAKVTENRAEHVMDRDKYGRPIKRPPTPDSADKDEKYSIPEKKTSSCGTNTEGSSNQPPKIIIPRVRQKEEPKKEIGPDTVFLDLRHFDKVREEKKSSIEKVQKILQIQGEGDSDSDDEVTSWHDMRKRMKQNLVAKGVSTEALPNKPRSVDHVKPPQRVIDMSHTSPRPAPETRGEGDAESDVDTQSEARRRALQVEKEKIKRMEEARKLREKREAERQSRVRLSKQLDALRPQASVSGKQDCAETTSAVYDLEVSYEPAPHSLPSILQPEHECLLLTIHLSSNGEIVLHRGKSNKSVDTGLGLSASYTVLLTWLLSLVPDKYDFLQSKNNSNELFVPPFHVLGLQQLWLEEQHALVVAVSPAQKFDSKHSSAKHKKGKVKDEVKDSSPFHQHLSKYFSTNTLHSVCPWLQDMVSAEVPSAYIDAETNAPTYVYRPPLPHITTKPLSTFIQINPDYQAAQKVFNTSVGFFWQTVDSEENFKDQAINDTGVTYDTQNTMSLIYKKIFHDPRSMMGIFNRVLQEGIDLAGIRLLYPSQELMNLASNRPTVTLDNTKARSDIEMLNNIGPVLSVAFRGTFARTIWLDAVGPSDPSLARKTDPNSLCALYGGTSRDECLLFCPRNVTRVHVELARWFGGRVPPGGVMDVGTPYTRKEHLRSGSPKGRKGKKGSDAKEKENKHAASLHRPPATLSATTKSEIFLVLSPYVLPRCIGIIMATCQRRGYQIRGVRRTKLTTKRASSLGIDSNLISAFCQGTGDLSAEVPNFTDSASQQQKNTESLYCSLILQLQKENASHNAASLIEACMVQLTLMGVMGTIQSDADFPLSSRHLFHAARYSDGLLAMLGGDFSKCVDMEIQVNPSFVFPVLYTNPEVEEIVVLLMLGHEILKSSGLFIGKLLNMVPFSKNVTVQPLKEGFELLGMKWVPSLTMSQAKEVTPYEVGDRQWKENIHTLVTDPAIVLVLRGIDAFKKLESVIPSVSPRNKDSHIDYIMSHTAEESFSFSRVFFTDRELHSDPMCRPLLPFIPSIRNHLVDGRISKERMKSGAVRESIFDIMQSGPRLFTTFLLIKPRAVRRHLPKLLKKIVQEGFRLVAMRLQNLNREQATILLEHDEPEPETFEQHIEFLNSGPSLLLGLERENAVKKLIDLLGPQDPQRARRQSQFYWRGVFGADPVANALHGSLDYMTSMSEQKIFFPEGLCCEGTPDLEAEEISCPAVDSLVDIKFNDHRVITVKEGHNTTGAPESPRALLLQTTCIVLKPSMFSSRDKLHMGYVELIEGLLNNGFELVGARMIWFTQNQAQHFLHLINAGSFSQVPLLTSGASLVLALQRDNAVIAFDTLMGSYYGANSLIGHYGDDIARPSELKQAHNLLAFFFDELMPGSQIQIVPKGQQIQEDK